MSHLKLATKLFINNEWVDAVSGKTFVVIDPATEQIIAHVAEGDKADVQKAVTAARAAFNPWRKMDPSQRGVLLNKLADLIEKNIDEFASIESIDAGKPLGQARYFEIPTAIAILRYFAGWCDKIHGKTLPVEHGLFAYTRREPMGVVAAIIPWNLPLVMAMSKLAPALATGNCIVLKPAEQAPLTPLKLGEMFKEAGFPPGVVNIITGFGPTAGAALSLHMDIDKISFTGSVEVGKIIQRASGESNLKRVTLELGGKSPLIIFNDADLDQAIEISHQAVFFNQGQACMAGSRLFVQEGIYDEFVKRVTERAKKRTVGAPTDPNAEQGPQIDATQFNSVMKYIKAGKDQGAKLEFGGQQVGTKGYFIQPTVFSGVKDDMTIAKEEIFGPVLSILKFSTLDEVIERANNTFFGLASGICTKDLSTAIKCADELRTGSVWINTYAAIKVSTPFGGYKQSGIGREFGKYGLAAYSEIKSVVIKM